MDSATDEPFSDLIARLYAGIDAEQPWQDFLEALAKWMEAAYATLIITAPGTRLPGTLVTPGVEPQDIAAYIEGFFADDPFHGLPEGQVTSFAQFLAEQPPESFAGYRDYLKLAASEKVLAVDLRFGGRFEARFRVTRDSGEPEFLASERGRLQQLVPHLRIAVGLFEKLQFAGAQRGVFHSAAEGLGLALVVLDRERRVVSSNALAEQILAQGEGVRRAGDTLLFTDQSNARALASLLVPGVAAAPLRFRIDRPVHGDLVATARPMDLPAIHSGTGALALLLARPGGETAPNPAALRELYGLTQAEARLAAVLAEGCTLVAAAHRLGIAHNTAKAQLRAVFAKTGVHRQAQLVSLLATLGG